jgi:adenosylhomocysteine nucleosidase
MQPPNFPKHELPFLGKAVFESDPDFTNLAVIATEQYLTEGLHEDISTEDLRVFHIADPRCMKGVIASGDQFITDPAKLDTIKSDIWKINGLHALCVDMESAAMAHACWRYGISNCVAIRVISDSGSNFDYLVPERKA